MLIAGKYRLERLIARGGAGKLYLARHVLLDDAFMRVVKVLESNKLEEISKARFYREVQLTARAAQANEHIIRIYDDFGHEPYLGYYYVMEYLEGSHLGDFLSQQVPLPLPLALELFAQLCDAMSAAHQVGVIHRDLKPENILLVEKGIEERFIKVIDFGIARTMNSTQFTHPSQGLLGTPLYMSPEQCLNKKIDHRVDIYAMGMILYEMLTGHLPYEYPTDSPDNVILSVIFNHINAEPTPIRRYRPDLSPLLEEVILQSLAKEPALRFASVEDFWEAIAETQETTIAAPIPELSFTHHHEPDDDDPTEVFRPTEPSIDAFGYEPDSVTVIATPFGQEDFFLDAPVAPTPDTEPIPDVSYPPSALSTAQGQNLIVEAEEHTRQLHQQSGPQSLDWLQQHKDALWELATTHRQTHPAMSLRALVAVYQTVKHNGTYHTYANEMQKSLVHAERCAPSLLIEAYLTLAEAYYQLSDAQEAQSLLVQALPLAITHIDKARLFNQLGRVYRVQSDLDASRDYHQKALRIFEETDDNRGRAEALSYLGNLGRYQGQPDEAMRQLRQALELYRIEADQNGEGMVLGQLWNLHRSLGEFDEAKQCFQKALALHTQQQAIRSIAITRNNLGHILVHEGQFEAATDQYQQAIRDFEQLNDKRGYAIAVSHTGDLARRRGLYQQARTKHDEVLGIHQSTGDRRGEAISLNHLANLAIDQGDLDFASKCLQRANTLLDEIEDLRGIGHMKMITGRLSLAKQELFEAGELFDEASAALNQSHDHYTISQLYVYQGILAQMAGGMAAAQNHFKQALIQSERLFSPHLEAWVLIFFSALEATIGNGEKAAAALNKAQRHFQRSQWTFANRLATLCNGHLLLAWARDAKQQNDPMMATLHLEAVAELLENKGQQENADSRLAYQLLQRSYMTHI
jgi:serine/threonine protein kinase/predicted translin family RNA/ssDNA-binding protein